VTCEEKAGDFFAATATCLETTLEKCACPDSQVGPYRMERLERVISAMSRQLDQPMTNAHLADIACLSPCHFNRVFCDIVGIPPIQFFYALRLKQAKRLLMETDLPITDICFDVGYNSLGTFTRRFNQLVGLPPRAFRNLSQHFVSLRLSDFRLPLLEAGCLPVSERSIDGRVCGARSDGLTFVALFPRAIPEGIPVACAFADDKGAYVLPHPGCGTWFVFAVTVPWNADGRQLATLDGFARGRSGPIRAMESSFAETREIKLSSACSLDPPVLTALPVLMNRMFATWKVWPSKHTSLLQSAAHTIAVVPTAHAKGRNDLLNLEEDLSEFNIV
jgi:AraC-like DNA-binding protein